MRPYVLTQTLTGGVTYDAIALPERVKRVCISSVNSASALNIKFHGESTILALTALQVYDSDEVDWQNPTVTVNGTGVIQTEYWA